MGVKKVALITGAGSGLGAGLARAFARAGYDIAIHTGSNEERARALAAEIHADTGRRAEAFVADFSKGGGARRLFEQYNERFDRLDLFVGNAGVTVSGRILAMTEERFDLVNSIDWKSAFFCVQEAAKTMINSKTMTASGRTGSMVLISSNHHAIIGSGNSPYSIAKESIVKFTKHAALELSEHGIRVNCIAPGWINTGEPRMEGYYEDSLNSIPMRRWLEPDDIAEWILFMAGPAGASLTGDTIELDGGARLLARS